MAANTWTYTHDPAHSVRDCVRFLVQDTDETDCQLSDSEIEYFILTYKKPRVAAIHAARTLATKYARLADEKTGRVEVKWSQRSRAFSRIADELIDDLNRTSVPSLFTGGISVSDMEQRILDPNRPADQFYLDQMDNLQVRP